MSDDDDLAAEIRALRVEVEALQDRVSALESTTDTDPAGPNAEREPGSGDAPSASTDAKSASTGAQSPPTDTSSASDSVIPVAGESQPDQGDDSAAAETGDDGAPPSPEEGPANGTRNWERDVGMKWLGGIGGLALVVGVVFFIRLAIEAGYLGPLGRVAVGAVGGLVLLAGGRFAAERQGYRRWGRLVAGSGLAITYFSVYAAYGFDSYRAAIGTPLWAVLLGLTVLVAATVALSVRDGAPLVAGEAFLLGYVTAYLGLDAGTFVVSPAYVLLLAAGLVVMVTIRPWSGLVLASVVPTYVLHVAWIDALDPPESLATGVLAATFGLYLAGAYVLRASDREDRRHLPQIDATTVLNAGLAALLLELTVRELVPAAPEGLAVAAVGLILVGVAVLTERRFAPQPWAAGTSGVVLVAASVLLAAEPFLATVGLLVVLCSALAAGTLRDAAAFRAGGHLVAVGIVLKLLVVDSWTLPAFDIADPATAATGRPVAFLLAAGSFYALAWWFRGSLTSVPATDREFPVAAPYGLAGTGLVFVLLGLELSGATLSAAWAILGLLFVGAGLATDARDRRLQGVIILGLVTGKVFLYDTRGLDTLARTLSFLVLGGILLAASYAYARWQGTDPLKRFTG